MNGAKARRVLLLGVLASLAPARLGEPLPARADTRTQWRVEDDLAAALGAEGLELSAPDLLGEVLRVEFAPGYAQTAAGQAGPPPELSRSSDLALLALGPAPAGVVAEPPRALLLALMLAGVAGASRGRRRCPRPLRRR